METPTLIYCGGGNPRFAKIALEIGFQYGAQLPDTTYASLYFADQDWRNPNRTAYMASLAKHRPQMATVLDWEKPEQLHEVLDWAEEAAQYVSRDILIVPKVIGGIRQLPKEIAGRRIVLAYSVPTKYAGTDVPIWEFANWPVHLLGGSPHRQLELYHYLSAIAEVVSADGNMINKMAMNCQFWVPGTAKRARNRWWPTLQEAGVEGGHDALYEAFRRSCLNIVAAWTSLNVKTNNKEKPL